MLRLEKRSAQQLSRSKANTDPNAVSSTDADTTSDRDSNAIADAKADAATNNRPSWLSETDSNAKEEKSAN
jgi:hypothetical protein